MEGYFLQQRKTGREKDRGEMTLTFVDHKPVDLNFFLVLLELPYFIIRMSVRLKLLDEP